jgi:hypothetical protein
MASSSGSKVAPPSDVPATLWERCQPNKCSFDFLEAGTVKSISATHEETQAPIRDLRSAQADKFFSELQFESHRDHRSNGLEH